MPRSCALGATQGRIPSGKALGISSRGGLQVFLVFFRDSNIVATAVSLEGDAVSCRGGGGGGEGEGGGCGAHVNTTPSMQQGSGKPHRQVQRVQQRAPGRELEPRRIGR